MDSNKLEIANKVASMVIASDDGYYKYSDLIYMFLKGYEANEHDWKRQFIKKVVKETCELENRCKELERDKEELCHSINEAGKACVYLNGRISTAKEIIRGLLIILHETATDEYDFEKAAPYQYKQAENFLKEE